MDHVFAFHLVFLDELLPDLVTGFVGQVEVDDVEVFQAFVFLLRMLKEHSAGRAPGPPDVYKDELTLIRLNELSENNLPVAHALHDIV